MLIFAFKIIITPLLIGLVTLVGRKWGTIVSGCLIGLPLTSGPISLILAMQYGPEFAVRSAIGSLAGQVSICIFCLVYYYASQKHRWAISVIISAVSFLAATSVFNYFSWSLMPAVLILVLTTFIVSQAIPNKPVSSKFSTPPAWDIPARMIIATAFVCLLTTVADRLGPQLSGLLAPFPVFSLVISAFTHQQQGADSTARLLRGIVTGSIAYAGFFLMVHACLLSLGIAITFTLAAMTALSVSSISIYISRRQAA
ncbi:MAG TPA: hypothetical protein VLX29_01925 [Nitrospirota bacterium]|nr:hypothetical protein [Nitrospirota bacterium]